MGSDGGDWRLSGLPRPLPLEAYRRAREDFVRCYRRLRGVRAIYRIGSVSCPGLSDLDFVVALEDTYRHRFGAQYGIRQFSWDTQYALYHPAIFVPEGLFADLRLLWPVFEMEHVSGRECPAPAPPPEQRRPVSLLHLCESVVYDMTGTIVRYLATRQVSVRLAQAKLNLLARNLRTLGELAGGTVAAADDFAAGVADLRERWFSRPEAETRGKLLELLAAAGELLVALAGELAAAVADEFGDDGAQAEGSELDRGRGMTIRFAQGPGPARWGPSGGGTEVVLPAALSLPLRALRAAEGPLGEYVRRIFSGPGLPPRTAHGELLARMAEASNRHCRFLTAAGLNAGGLNYWGFRPPESRSAVDKGFAALVNASRRAARKLLRRRA